MEVLLAVTCDFITIHSEIPKDENCPKCAFMLNGRCEKRYQGTSEKGCNSGLRGYYSKQRIREVTENDVVFDTQERGVMAGVRLE